MPAVFAGAQEDVVGNRIQLRGPLRPGQRAAADDETDALACQPHVVEQGGKIAGGLRKPALLLDHELGDGLLVSAHHPPLIENYAALGVPGTAANCCSISRMPSVLKLGSSRSAAEKSCARVQRLGLTTVNKPAALAAVSPLEESSMAAHSRTGWPNSRST